MPSIQLIWKKFFQNKHLQGTKRIRFLEKNNNTLLPAASALHLLLRQAQLSPSQAFTNSALPSQDPPVPSAHPPGSFSFFKSKHHLLQRSHPSQSKISSQLVSRTTFSSQHLHEYIYGQYFIDFRVPAIGRHTTILHITKKKRCSSSYDTFNFRMFPDVGYIKIQGEMGALELMGHQLQRSIYGSVSPIDQKCHTQRQGPHPYCLPSKPRCLLNK